MYSTVSNLDLLSSAATSKYMNLFQAWQQYSSNNDGSFHYYNPYIVQKPHEEEHALEKFHHDTLVTLETGVKKNIQQLTTNDLLASAKLSQQYSSLLARVEYIGGVDKRTGKAELRLYINGIEKIIPYYVQQEMPFFVHQYSCWSSVSPKYTQHIFGLNCRQLECGDLIIVVTDKHNVPLRKNVKPNYSQQSPMKCLVERYMNEKISSTSSYTSNDSMLPKNKRFKAYNEEKFYA